MFSSVNDPLLLKLGCILLSRSHTSLYRETYVIAAACSERPLKCVHIDSQASSTIEFTVFIHSNVLVVLVFNHV